jgi:hypothetical protein
VRSVAGSDAFAAAEVPKRVVQKVTDLAFVVPYQTSLSLAS